MTKTSSQTDSDWTDQPIDEANSTLPFRESTNHLQKQFNTIVPAAHRSGHTDAVNGQPLHSTQTRLYLRYQE